MAAETQKKHRFNVVDFVLIIAVLACCVSIVIRYHLHTDLLRDTDTARITVRIESLLNDSVNAMQAGDQFYNTVTEKEFGTLVSVDATPAKTRGENTDGSIQIVYYENRSDLVCVFEISGYQTENGFMMGGTTFIGCGSTFNINSRKIATLCTVLDIELQESGT